jgi:hypothetical protein
VVEVEDTKMNGNDILLKARQSRATALLNRHASLVSKYTELGAVAPNSSLMSDVRLDEHRLFQTFDALQHAV